MKSKFDFHPEGSFDVCLFAIGSRDDLSKQEARCSAKLWCETVQRAPKAVFVLHLAGFDDDPREIWEFADAARYVRWWARYAGMGDVDVADRLLASGSSLSFLAACGVFGEE